MRIDAGPCVLRPLVVEDAAPLARQADDPLVVANLRDAFPHPYTILDGIEFISLVSEREPGMHLGIEVGGGLAGVIGARRGDDVYRFSAEIGYFLGRGFWGRGLATAAVRAFVAHLWSSFDLERLYAGVFSGNPSSVKVLEKAGFQREGILRRHVCKNGVFRDEWVFGIVRGGRP